MANFRLESAPQDVFEMIALNLRGMLPSIEVACEHGVDSKVTFALKSGDNVRRFDFPSVEFRAYQEVEFINALFDTAESWIPKPPTPVCDTRRISSLARYGSKKNRGFYQTRRLHISLPSFCSNS
jgi:hypothetical protein